MSCFFHQNKENVAQCPQCGKYLCRECGSLTTGGLCYACSKQIHDNAKNELIFTIISCIVMIICYIVGVIFTTNENQNMGILFFTIGGIIPAWKILTRIADRLFGVRAYAGMMLVIAFFVKLILSIFLGFTMIFVYIVKLLINIINYVRISKDMKIINNNFVNIA